MASSLVGRSNIRWSLGDEEGALADLREALAIREAHLGADHPSLNLPLGNLGVALIALGREAEALPVFARAEALAVRVHPDDHPDVVYARSGRAHCLAATGQVVEARALYTLLEVQTARVEGDPCERTEILANHGQTPCSKSNTTVRRCSSSMP